jgi:hypothetical protein
MQNGTVISVKEALETGTTVRSAMMKLPEETEKAFYALCAKTFEHIGAVRKIDSPEGFAILMHNIVECHPQMMLEEFIPFFRGLMRGDYDPHFNSADQAWVMRCLNQYVERVQAPAREELNRAPPFRGVQSGNQNIYNQKKWSGNKRTLGDRLRDVLGTE